MLYPTIQFTIPHEPRILNRMEIHTVPVITEIPEISQFIQRQFIPFVHLTISLDYLILICILYSTR